MKKLNLLIMLILPAFFAWSQNEKGQVHLKNGSIIKGKYQWLNNSETLRVESGGNIWMFDAAEVSQVMGKKPSGKMDVDTMHSPKSLFVRTELGIMAGNSQNSQPAPFSFTTSVNYRLFSRFSIGIGAGAEFLKESYLPAFINLEYTLRPDRSSPYVFLKGGYQVPLEEANAIYNNAVAVSRIYLPWPGPVLNYTELDPAGGLMLNPGIGYSHYFTSAFGLSVAFGYQFHRLGYTAENDYRLNIDYNRLTVKLGIIFN